MTTPKNPTKPGMHKEVIGKKDSPAAIESENEYLKIEISDLKTKITVLTKECDVLRIQLAKMSSLGNQQRERLVNKLLKKYPDCFQELDFDNAYEQAIKKLPHNQPLQRTRG